MSACYEVGPIRPPSEATSLLVRVTRNCPWNRCSFCPVYKSERFALRPLGDIKADIQAMAAAAGRLRATAATQTRALSAEAGPLDAALLRELVLRDPDALSVAVFLAAGGTSAFLQDADSLVVPVDGLVDVLRCLRAAFPTLSRITSYARARTIVRRSVADLSRLRVAGLDRIHIGLESGADAVLELVDKGASAAQQIEAGRRAKAAGMEVSLYVMPGLGGKRLSTTHARETARALRAIDPHFVRLRSLAVAPGTPLHDAALCGDFEPLGDIETVAEIRALVAGLTEMTATVTSDHVLNLLGEVEGTLPGDQAPMLALLDTFLGTSTELQQLFVVGRRLGLLTRPIDLHDERLRARVEVARDRLTTAFGGDLSRAIEQLRLRL